MSSECLSFQEKTGQTFGTRELTRTHVGGIAGVGAIEATMSYLKPQQLYYFSGGYESRSALASEASTFFR